jgi:predicted ATP-grasp superfamily ATP-dependent carboligase
LSGLFGVDLILDSRGRMHVLEINPRYTAAMELLELAHGHALLGENIEALKTMADSVPTLIHGKAIVYARETVRVDDLYAWFNAASIADVPQIGEVIPQGRPICTLLARGNSTDHVLAELHDMAGSLYTRLQP